MIFPSLHKADVKNVRKHTFIKEHTKEHDFYYITERNGFYFLYTSPKPTVAIAESYLQQLHSDTNDWSVIHVIDATTCYFMFISAGDIITAHITSFDELNDIYLARSSFIYQIDESRQYQFERPDIASKVHVINPIITTSYKLKPYEKLPIKTISIASILLMGVIGGALFTIEQLKPPPPPPVVVPVDPYMVYRQSVTTTLSASHTIETATKLAAILAQVPAGWSPENISLNSSRLVATIKRSDNGSLAAIRHWLEQHPDIKHFSQFSEISSVQISIPINETLDSYVDRIMPIQPLSQSLIDYLIASNWKVERNSTSTVVTSHDLICSNQITLTTLLDLSSLSENLPIGITELNISPLSENGTVAVALTLLVIGDKA
ncbi:hypothetical protein QMU85_002064 [Photobacterium damselae]|nr:hypothetical protein [Photobacterium damselae]